MALDMDNQSLSRLQGPPETENCVPRLILGCVCVQLREAVCKEAWFASSASSVWPMLPRGVSELAAGERNYIRLLVILSLGFCRHSLMELCCQFRVENLAEQHPRPPY